MRHVIIGTGAAGMEAARAIRETDVSAEIAMVGDEQFLPYNRYQLTDFLCDVIAERELFPTTASFFDEMGIRVRKGQTVDRIHPQEKTVRFAHEEVVSYDRLLVATGRHPVLSPTLRPFAKLIQRYYSYEDVQVIRKRLPGIREIVVSGRGLSILDLIHGMHRLGKKVTYVIRDAVVEAPTLDPILSRSVDAVLVEKGVEILREDQVAAIEERGNRYSVRTMRGRERTADMVFAWDSYEPCTRCLQGTEIEVKSGILVDLQMRTNLPDIYAAGDCAEIYHPSLKNYWINFGWPNAVEQGRVAGRNMAGRNEEYQIHETTVFNILGKSLEARWWD